jgi:hypothetical protein
MVFLAQEYDTARYNSEDKMDEQTASKFTQALAVILGAYVDASKKVTALEAALKEHDLVLYALYLNHLEKDGKKDNSGTQVSLALEHLQGLLEK